MTAGPVLKELTAIGQRQNCTMLLIHHFRKNGAVD